MPSCAATSGSGPQPNATPAPAQATEHPLLHVTSLRAGAQVTSPLVVTGEARGTWFFEATFPVRVLDANGRVLGEHYAEASAEWMTEAFVPFRAEVRFESPTTATGTLVLEKNNPSDLREHDDAVRVPIRFRSASKP